jgi:hypothetical protein
MSAKKASSSHSEGYQSHWFKLTPLFEQCRVTNTAVDFAPTGTPKASIVPVFVNHRLQMAPSFMQAAFPLTVEERARYADAFRVRVGAAGEISVLVRMA